MKKRIILSLIIFLSIFFFLSLPSLSAASEVSLIRDISTTTNTNWSSNLSGVFHSSLVLGDIDGDDDYDMIAMGCTTGGVDTCTTADKIRVYVNNGTTFNEDSTWESNTTNLGYGSLALGDIDNDGDLDLVALGDVGGGTGDIKIYVNNGTAFDNNLIWEENLSNVDAYAGSLAFGDVDNDGDLDLALVGAYPSSDNGIYLNNGTSFIKDSTWITSPSLVGHGLGMGTLAFGDIDNDGDLDLVFAGSYSTNFYTVVYLNNGTSLVDNSSWKGDFTATFGWPSLTLGDYDNDGDLDLAAIGTRAGDHHKIYNNTGSSFSFNQERGGAYDGSIAFGDFDNDGDLDLALIGKEPGSGRIYLNNKTTFEIDIFEQQDMDDDAFYQGGLAWCDIDEDYNIDLIINGKSSVSDFKAYLSNASLTKNNTLPNASISSFSSSYSDGVLKLGWENGSDVETNSSGLYYNLMVGNSTDNHTIVSGVYGGSSNPTAGYFGNMMQRKNISLNKYLSAGTYKWYVQTIDTGLAKSNWSAMQSIVVGGDTTKPVISSVGSSVTSSTATITWTTDETSNSTVNYGTTPATTSSSSSDDLITSHSISLSSLSSSTLYYYHVSSCDYWNNCNVSTQYNFTTSATGNGGNGGNGGGGGGGGSSPTTTTPTNATTEEELFDVDFSKVDSGTLEAKQGDIKTFSFQGEVKHSITTLTLTSDAVTLLITSDPITIQIKTGEIKQIDMNSDEVSDLEIKLVSITNNVANLLFTKLEGADIVGKQELEEEIRKEALFDVKVSITNLFKIVKSGRDVIAEIEVFNVNNIGQVDVLVNYYLTDKENNTIAEGSDTLAVEAVVSFVRSLGVPYNTKSGKYLFHVDVKYKDKLMASGHTEFRVIRNYEIIIAISIIVLIVVGVFFYLWRIKKKEEKDVGMLRRQIRKLKRRKK